MKLSVQNLSKSYHDADRELTIIRELTFAFPARGAVAILGKSGVGKSTLLHLLGGLDHPSSGSVRYDDVDIGALRGDALTRFRGAHTGFIFQFHHLLPEFSALENAAMPLTIAGVPDDEAHGRAEALLKRVGLAQRLTHRPSQLSGGEQQRVALARAMVSRPTLLLGDEPTGNLDADTARAVQELLLELNRESGNTLILVTHNHDLARSMDLTVEMLPGGELRSTTL